MSYFSCKITNNLTNLASNECWIRQIWLYFLLSHIPKKNTAADDNIYILYTDKMNVCCHILFPVTFNHLYMHD